MDSTDYSGILLVATTPNPGIGEAEFNAWYANVHLKEIRERVPGIEGVERFRSDGGEDQAPRFLTVYRISRPASAILEDMRTAGLSDASPVIDMSGNPPAITSYDTVS